MTQKDKELLLKDLYARLPYGFIVLRCSDNCIIVIESNGIDKFAHFLEYSEGEDFKPYLRPMSSMTKEEEKEYHKTFRAEAYGNGYCYVESVHSFDWLDAHHFDYRGLIEKYLALEAPEGMYNLKEK